MFSERNIPEIVTKVGTCAGNWLKLETGARAIGMGGAYSSVYSDPSVIYWNPGAIARFENDKLTSKINLFESILKYDQKHLSK